MATTMKAHGAAAGARPADVAGLVSQLVMQDIAPYPAEHVETLHVAMRYLSARCDGALALDGQGFAAGDSPAGKGIAGLPTTSWTPSITSLAFDLARKYRAQLEVGDIDVAVIPKPPATYGGRDEAKAVLNRSSRQITLTDTGYALSFDYDEGMVDVVRELAGARWDPGMRVWMVARSTRVAAIVGEYGFQSADALTANALAIDAGVPRAPTLPGVRLEGDGATRRIIVSFPYDRNLVSMVKGIVGASFNAAGHYWTIPVDQADAAVEFARNAALDFDPTLTDLASEAKGRRALDRAASSAIDASLDLPESLSTLRPFQCAGVVYVLDKRRAIIGDQVGLGKTVQALASIELAGAYPAIVVCPASLKLNWQAEVVKWLPGRSVTIVSGTKVEAIERADVVVVNYDLLAARKDDLAALEPRALVMDEFQAAKNAKAKRTKALRALANDLPDNALRLGLSGTAILNRPAELIEPLRILGRFEEVGGTWTRFVTRYCGGHLDRFGWDISGSGHLVELHDRLTEVCYVRRTKQDVMPQLPPIQDAFVPIDLSVKGRQEYERIEADVIEYLGSKAAEIALEIGDDPSRARWEAKMRAASAECLVRMNALRECVGRAKTPGVIEWVNDWLEDTDEKLILFAWHKSVQHALIKATGAPAILGAQAGAETEEAKRRFQEDPECRLIVCSLQAASEGHTLTAASAVALVELPWTPARVEQAFGRAYGRLSDAHSITGYRLLGEHTIDDDLAALLASKGAIGAAVLDGTVTQPDDGSVAGDLLVQLARRGLERSGEQL